MGRYSYEGRNRKGKTSGYIIASSKREAVTKLGQSGIRVQKIEEATQSIFMKDISFGKKVKLKHFVIFLRQFSTLLKAGVTMVESTKILAHQTDNKYLRNALLDIEQELKEGNPLSVATSRHKTIFSTLFRNMVSAGEASGNLDEVFDRLAIHYEKQYATQQKVKSALAYPLFVCVLSIAVLIFLLIVIVPTFVDLFAEAGGELPAITKFVLNASHYMQSSWYVIILCIGAIVALFMAFKSNKRTKYYYDYAVLKVPIFGKLFQKAVLARFTRTLSSLFSSSVPILQAMTIVEKIVENEVIADVIKQSRDTLEKGQSITVPMKNHWVFPPLVTQMIAIGEETGSLDSMLAKVADFYEQEVEHSTDQLKSLIEPIMILVLALVVGTIVASILVPMFEIFNQVGNY